MNKKIILIKLQNTMKFKNHHSVNPDNAENEFTRFYKISNGWSGVVFENATTKKENAMKWNVKT